ncbi:MAG: 50S ribosomal protein L3 [Endomicrobium sp.]|jgi:large subunit ribosomal protein L3|nr:50S ribosomal protein L3 [Endomicrobium sp.]
MLKSIIGKKAGMMQFFNDKGDLIPVTVIEAGPCVVVGIRTIEKDNYSAIQIAFESAKEKNLSKPEIGLFHKHNLLPKKKIKEFKVLNTSEFIIGQRINVDVFKIGDYVDVSAIAKGKGYAGVIKRHNFSMQPTTHGQSDRSRARGSSGGQGPQKVLKGTKMSGHLGNKYVTIQNLCVVSVDVKRNALLVKGSVPGVKTGTLFVRSAVKKSIYSSK